MRLINRWSACRMGGFFVPLHFDRDLQKNTTQKVLLNEGGRVAAMLDLAVARNPLMPFSDLLELFIL